MKPTVTLDLADYDALRRENKRLRDELDQLWAQQPPVYSQGTLEVANLLDQLEVPLTATYSQAHHILDRHGHGRRKQVVLDALRYRRECAINQ